MTETKYRMKLMLQITKIIPDEAIMTPQGPRAKEVSGESIEAIAERHTRGACLDELMEDSPVGDAIKRIHEEQRVARGALEH